MSKVIRVNRVSKEELRIIDRINRDCLKMHLIPPCIPKIKLQVHIPDGRGGWILESESEQLSKSWTRIGYNFLASMMMGLDSNAGGTSFGAGMLPVKDYGGNLYQASYPIAPHFQMSNASFEGAVGDATTGIVVGTSSGAFSFEGYALGAKIAHGNGAGQFSYTAQTATAVSYVAGTKTFTATFVRIFNNNSGGSITVEEVGIYANLYNPNSYKFMIIRDLSTKAVADTAQLTVTITIDLVYPA